MKKEVINHQLHLTVTFERLIAVLFPFGEFEKISQNKEHFIERIETRSQWVTVDELVIPPVTTAQMVLIHLLWFQSIGRVVIEIEDVDPYSGALCLHLHLQKKTSPAPTTGKVIH